MTTTPQDEKEWVTDSLADAVSSFFARYLKGEEGQALSRLSHLLTLKASSGSSHLLAEEATKINPNWQDLPAVGQEDANLPFVYTKAGKLYFRRFYEYEKQIATVLKKRLDVPSSTLQQGSLEFFESSLAGQVDDQQAHAVMQALQKSFLLVTGGPGTGKTRTIVAILAAYIQNSPGKRIALTAPTGKAAFRMRESVMQTVESLNLPDNVRASLLESSRSSTIHRLLGSKHGSVGFRRNQANPLPHDLVIVDEASMVDLPLLAKLCQALREDAKFILVGDADQLAPVQGGAVFNGLVKPTGSYIFGESDSLPASGVQEPAKEAKCRNVLSGNLVKLSHVHRRDHNASALRIGELCDAIKDGRGQNALDIASSGEPGISWISMGNDAGISDVIRSGFQEFYQSEQPAKALSHLGKFRILCAYNDGAFGVGHWNLLAEHALDASVERPRPVVVGVNDYSVGLFNGDDGVVLGNRAFFASDEGVRELACSRLPQHQNGYATSIHRSQGSEFDKVLIVLPYAESKLLNRELLYVAVSRAKEKVFLVGSEESFAAAVMRSEKQNSGVWDLINHSTTITA
jgi:exodeoxyribonuclease V alpha subunit